MHSPSCKRNGCKVAEQPQGTVRIIAVEPAFGLCVWRGSGRKPPPISAEGEDPLTAVKDLPGPCVQISQNQPNGLRRDDKYPPLLEHKGGQCESDNEAAGGSRGEKWSGKVKIETEV